MRSVRIPLPSFARAAVAVVAGCASADGAPLDATMSGTGGEDGGDGEAAAVPVCGDGTVDVDEQCDDAGRSGGTLCTDTCNLPDGPNASRLVASAAVDVDGRLMGLDIDDEGRVVLLQDFERISEFQLDLWHLSFAPGLRPLWRAQIETSDTHDANVTGLKIVGDDVAATTYRDDTNDFGDRYCSHVSAKRLRMSDGGEVESLGGIGFPVRHVDASSELFVGSTSPCEEPYTRDHMLKVYPIGGGWPSSVRLGPDVSTAGQVAVAEDRSVVVAVRTDEGAAIMGFTHQVDDYAEAWRWTLTDEFPILSVVDDGEAWSVLVETTTDASLWRLDRDGQATMIAGALPTADALSLSGSRGLGTAWLERSFGDGRTTSRLELYRAPTSGQSLSDTPVFELDLGERGSLGQRAYADDGLLLQTVYYDDGPVLAVYDLATP